MKKLRVNDIELALSRFFNYRTNIIVPNVFWGWGLSYECDVLIVSPAGYAWEIEIKTSSQDIKNDLKKSPLAHNSNRIRKFSYAVADYLVDNKHLPTNCGLISVNKDLRCRTIRPPRLNAKARKLRPDEIKKILHLGCMRIWSLKKALKNKQPCG